MAEITKTGKPPRTVVTLSTQERRAIEAHWQRLQELGAAAERWRPEEDGLPEA
jgi:hypothetical protein